MSDLTDDILGNVDIVDVISRYVNLKRTGKNFVGLCPFHREKTPSFTVAQDKQIYKCFGCGAGGNVIKFIMEIEKADFWDAVKILSKDANIDLNKYKFSSSKQEKNIEEKEKYKLLNKHAKNFFVNKLEESDLAKKYLLQDRKLSQAIIDKFEIGFAPDSHYEIIKLLQSKGFSIDDIIKVSLGKKGSTQDIYSFFRNRIIFPIYDHMDNIVSFAGRALTKDDNPKYLNTTETPLYDKSKILYGMNIAKNHIRDYDKLIVVEGYMDVIGLARADMPIGVATCGTALTPGHIKLMKRYTSNLVFAFDNDDAGFEASIRGLKIAYEYEIFPQIFSLPENYKDIDEYVNEVSKKDVLDNLEKLEDGFDFVLRKLRKKYNLNSPTQRKEVINKLFDVLVNINNYSILSFYLEKIANTFGLNQDMLFNQLKAYKKTANRFMNYAGDEDNTKQKDNKPAMLASLFYNDFLSENQLVSEKINNYVNFFKELSQYFPNSMLGKAFEKKLNNDDIDELKMAQLRWEKDLDISVNKKEQLIINFLKIQIKEILQHVLKLSQITDAQKQDIIKKKNNLLKS